MTTSTKLNTRKAGSGKNNKKHRGLLIAATSLAVAGLVIGGGVASQSAMAAQEKVEATAAAANHADAKAKTQQDATATLDSANQVLAAAQGKVDTTALTASVTSLADYKAVTLNVTASRIADTTAQTTAVQTATTDADRVAADAEAQRVAAEAAAATAAQATATAATAAVATEASNTPEGAQATARDMGAARYGWGESEMSCLTQLWDKESGWSYTATNASSGATGIPQALPGSKMAVAGGDWATNASTQVSWGLGYVKDRFGTPCAAWAHSESVGWY